MITAVYKKSTNEVYVKNITSPADEIRHVNFIHTIILNRWNQLAVLLILTAVISPIVLILTIYSLNIPMSPSNPIDDTCDINSTYQVQCGTINVSSKDCESLGCCFVNNFCYHRAPSRYGYKLYDENSSDDVFIRRQKQTPLLNPSYEQLQIVANEISTKRLNIILYNPAMVQIDSKNDKQENKMYNYTITNYANIIVNRTRNDLPSQTILTTSYGPLIASDNYWEMTISLQSEHIFGFGEVYLKKNKKFIFYNNPRDLNRLPIVMAYKDYQYHGVYIKTSSLLEIEILPSKLLILRSLTSSGIGFEFDVVVGDTPADITQVFRQMHHKTDVPPYWTLGVHVCRNTKNAPDIPQLLQEVKTFQKNAKSLKFPYESECIHENLFSLTMSVTDVESAALTECVENEIIKMNRHFIMPFSPEIRNETEVYDTAQKDNLLYLNSSNCEVITAQDNVNTEQSISYPNYKIESSDKWFSKFIANIPGINYASGIIIRNSWPLYENFTENLTDSQLIYYNNDIEHTLASILPWNATTECSNNQTNYHIETHNQYGFDIAQKFHNYFQQQQHTSSNIDNVVNPEFILSGSTYFNNINNNFLYGTINQNLNISWLNLQKQLTNSLFYSIFVNSVLHVTPVCGTTDVFNVTLHEEVCLRWYYLTATLPMFYISSVEPYRDPFNLPTKFVRDGSINAIRRRYELLPYFNTILRTKDGSVPLVRPMFYNFPYDNKTFELNQQYMIGDALLSVQIMSPNQQNEPLNIYLPMNQLIVDSNMVYEANAWYEYRNGKQFMSPADEMRLSTGGNHLSGRTIQMPVRNADWIMFILGGYIIAIHDYMEIKAGTADELRKKLPLTIVVALKCTDNLPINNNAGDDDDDSEINTEHIQRDHNSKFIGIPFHLHVHNGNIPVKKTKKDNNEESLVCHASGEHLVNDNDLTYMKFTSNRTHLHLYNLNEVKLNVCNNVENIHINQIRVYGINKLEVLYHTQVEINVCELKEDDFDVLYDFSNN